MSFHLNSKVLDGLEFVGLGGSNNTPFDTPFELSEGEILEKLMDLTKDLHRGWILVTHTPPYNTCADRTAKEVHVGSESVREVIETREPLANLCGHVHEARCIDEIGGTKVVNPGPVSDGYAAELIFENEIEINLLEV